MGSTKLVVQCPTMLNFYYLLFALQKINLNVEYGGFRKVCNTIMFDVIVVVLLQ